MSIFSDFREYRARRRMGASANDFWGLLEGYHPVFSSFNGECYEKSQVRSAMHANATHRSKLDIEIVGPRYRDLGKTIGMWVNPYQTTAQFLYKISTISDAENAQIVDGHYEIDGKRVTTTTENTGWQVQVFDYEEAQAMQLTFYDDMPAIVLGGGATNANSTGLIMKTESGVLISYTTKDGKQLYVKLDDSGRIICKDALTSVDLRNLDNGTFTMTYDGKPVTYGFEETAAGYKLTKPNGEGVVTFAT